MTRRVRLWIIGGLILGILAGVLVGYMLRNDSEDPILLLISWSVILGIGGMVFFGLWSYADEQQRRIRRPDLFKNK